MEAVENATEPVIDLTPDAAAQIKSLREKEAPGQQALRLYVDKGGCSGLQYAMVFDEPRPEDISAAFHGVSILIDPVSLQYLRGARVDYVDALTGGGFKISNPNAKQSCGCGKSFET